MQDQSPRDARFDGQVLIEPMLQEYPNLAFMVDYFAWTVPGYKRQAEV